MGEPVKVMRVGQTEAVRFNGSSSHAFQIQRWIDGIAPPSDGMQTCDTTQAHVKTTKGTLTLNPGDWIVKDHTGQMALDDSTFRRTYTETDETGGALGLMILCGLETAYDGTLLDEIDTNSALRAAWDRLHELGLIEPRAVGDSGEYEATITRRGREQIKKFIDIHEDLDA